MGLLLLAWLCSCVCWQTLGVWNKGTVHGVFTEHCDFSFDGTAIGNFVYNSSIAYTSQIYTVILLLFN